MQTVLIRVEGIATLLLVHEIVTGLILTAMIILVIFEMLNKVFGNVFTNITTNCAEFEKETKHFFRAWLLLN